MTIREWILYDINRIGYYLHRPNDWGYTDKDLKDLCNKAKIQTLESLQSLIPNARYIYVKFGNPRQIVTI